MRRLVLVVLAILVIGLGALSVFVGTFKAKHRPASTEKVDPTPARLERGRYLVDVALGCMDCHSKHDLTKFGGPATGPAGQGGECIGEQQGFPGQVCMANITPDPETGLGNWTDGEIIRAVREGVDKDGQALFPMMPYTEYKALSDEDARAMVAYLRSLPPVKNVVPERVVKFPLSFFMKLAPKPLDGPIPTPDPNDKVAHGKYLAKVSGCQSCHTPVDRQHQPLPGQDFSGGQEFPGPWGALRSANLTPDPTGLGDRTQQAFVGMFKAFDLPQADLPTVTPAQNTVMPWLTRAKMTEADLGAIYTYLKTVPAVARQVEKRPMPKLPGAPSAAAPAGTPPTGVPAAGTPPPGAPAAGTKPAP